MMGTFACASSSFLLLPPPPSPSSSKSSCGGRMNLRDSRSYAVLQRRSAYSEFDLWNRGSKRATTARAEARPSSEFAAESRDQDDSSSQNEETGLFSGVSNGRIAGLATALLVNVVCGNALAETGASTAVANENNSNFMFLVICIGEAIALTGAAVGGIVARQRKDELEKLNAQLRLINANLRRQSRVETYAPSLTYAPVGSGRIADVQVRSDAKREELMQALRTGKRFLRQQNPVNAHAEFEKALALAQQVKDAVEEKKATRGLGASCQRQGKYKEAINHHLLVFEISKRTGENTGVTEAYGAIADCYTELGDLETAGKYYDKYIERLEGDDTLSF